MIAQTIAHYRIQAKIGAGGMGEVYRATDSHLGRDVALKVLPEAFAHDTQRMVRFEREAKVLASLNHPNIAAIYGLEESNGVRALVMELVEGLTLAERIKHGPLPLDEALPIAKQVAEGLEYAHERGIIHRDLKPANIKPTPDGQVKILDFGLAKALEGESDEQELQNSPTLSAAATRAGVLLGTAAYMSPEQARGKRVDRRADIWAFGCVLFEMVTGQGAFSGETTSDILAGVIRAEPDWPSLPSSVPPRLRALLRRCLQKDPKQRLQAIGDARIALDEILSAAAAEAEPAVAVGTIALPMWRRVVPWAAGTLLAVLVGIAVWELRPPPKAPTVVRFSFGPPTGDSLVFRLGSTPLAISPDGTDVVFGVLHNSTSQLYLKRIDKLESAPIRGSDNADIPFVSPDGRWIGFFSGGKLKKVSALGGEPVTLCDAPQGRGGSWAPDDSIIFAPALLSGLMRVPASGGTPQPFTKLDSSKSERSHRWPQVLPGGKTVLFTSTDSPWMGFDSAIAVATLQTGEVKFLPVRGAYARYVPEGYLVFEGRDDLFAVPFDLQRMAVSGSPFPVLQVQASSLSNFAAFAVSETGSLVYIPGGAFIEGFSWVDRKGALEPLGAPARDYLPRVQLSPDAKRVVVVVQEGGLRDVWVYDIARRGLTRLTLGDADNSSPSWSPDGRRITFLRHKDGNSYIVVKSADGSGGEETLAALPSLVYSSSWSPNGKFIAYSQIGRNGKSEIWVLPLEGEHKPQPLLANQFDESAVAFSPDGKYLAYVSNESGYNEVYVVPFGHGSGKWPISTGGGNSNFPVWAKNGKELFYRTDGNIVGVDIMTQPVFSPSAPHLIVPAKSFTTLTSRLDNFDVSPDGKRFLIHQRSSEPGQSVQINFVLNWSEELRRLSSARKQP